MRMIFINAEHFQKQKKSVLSDQNKNNFTIRIYKRIIAVVKILKISALLKVVNLSLKR